MKNETLDVIAARRSVRKYKPEMPPREQLQGVIDAGRQAPSGGNCQYNHFIAITDKALLEKLAQTAEKIFAAMEFDENTYKSIRSSILQSRKGGYAFHYDAPVLIVVANKADHDNAMADASCALENMMIASEALGLGACWINQLRWLRNEEAIREMLLQVGMAEDETIYGALAVGFPDEPKRKGPALKGNRVTWVE